MKTPQIQNNKLSSMVLMNYAVQCKDQNTQKTGCFLFDIEKWNELKSGDVIDVQVILGETSEKKISERLEVYP